MHYKYTEGLHSHIVLKKHGFLFKMKAVFLLGFLAVIGIACSAVVKAPRYSLNIGYVTAGDRLLNRAYLYQPPIANAVQFQDYVYRGNLTTRISAVQATEVGYTQYANPYIISGGIGYNNVTLRVVSARGYGFYYMMDVWGR